MSLRRSISHFVRFPFSHFVQFTFFLSISLSHTRTSSSPSSFQDPSRALSFSSRPQRKFRFQRAHFLNAKILFSIAAVQAAVAHYIHMELLTWRPIFVAQRQQTGERFAAVASLFRVGRAPTLCGCYEFLLSYRVEVLSTCERQRAIYMFPLAVCALRPQCSRSGLDVSLFSHIFSLELHLRDVIAEDSEMCAGCT